MTGKGKSGTTEDTEKNKPFFTAEAQRAQRKP